MRCMNQYIRNRVLLLQILYLKFSQKEEGHDTHDCLGNRKAEPDTCHSQKCGKQECNRQDQYKAAQDRDDESRYRLVGST